MATSCFFYYLFVGNKTPASNEAALKRQRNKKGHTIKLKAEAEVIVNK